MDLSAPQSDPGPYLPSSPVTSPVLQAHLRWMHGAVGLLVPRQAASETFVSPYRGPSPRGAAPSRISGNGVGTANTFKKITTAGSRQLAWHARHSGKVQQAWPQVMRVTLCMRVPSRRRSAQRQTTKNVSSGRRRRVVSKPNIFLAPGGANTVRGNNSASVLFLHLWCCRSDSSSEVTTVRQRIAQFQ